MSASFDIEKDNRNFLRVFRGILITVTVLIGIYLAVSTYDLLKSHSDYMDDWRGITSIVLTTLVFLLYSVPLFNTLKLDWPPPWYQAVSLWGGMYVLVLLLTLIDRDFLLDFYIVFAASFAQFEGWRGVIAVTISAVTLFAFQGVLIWPPSNDSMSSIASQSLTIVSITGFVMLFQHLMKERFERNMLFRQLARSKSELEEAHHQLEQSVEQEQELAVLRERTRLAREMHDTIGHALVLISVKLEAAQRLRERDPERCDHEMEATKQVARETMTALRASIADLRSPALERERINHALSRFAREFTQRTNLHVTYTLQADMDRLPEAIEETLWKVSQEAFTNIEKHAHASHVQMSISRQNEKVLMHIHDDGVGLPPELCRSQKDGDPVYRTGHYGLRGMFERVEALGGHLVLYSGEGEGTTIEVELPVSTG